MPLILLFTTMGVLQSCSNVEIKDQKWCGDQGTLGAHCAHTLSNSTYDYDYNTWANRRFGQLCTDDDPDKLGSQFAEMKKEVEELCSITNSCSYPQVTALRSFLNNGIKFQRGLKK